MQVFLYEKKKSLMCLRQERYEIRNIDVLRTSYVKLRMLPNISRLIRRLCCNVDR